MKNAFLFLSFLSISAVLPGSSADVESEDEMGKKSEKKALVDFEEEWSKISNGKLEIKWYYFPTTQSTKINIGDIQKVTVQSQANGYAKNWGSGDLISWWACDMKRNFRSKPENFYNVKIDNGDYFKKGLTVHEINDFLKALRDSGYSQPIVFD